MSLPLISTEEVDDCFTVGKEVRWMAVDWTVESGIIAAKTVLSNGTVLLEINVTIGATSW